MERTAIIIYVSDSREFIVNNAEQRAINVFRI